MEVDPTTLVIAIPFAVWAIAMFAVVLMNALYGR